MWGRVIFGAVFVTGAVFAADPDYFPLQAGNRWEYVSDSGERRVGEVLGMQEIGGRTWFRVRWLSEKEYMLRVEGNRLIEWEPVEAKEIVWADFDGATAVRIMVCVGAGLVTQESSEWACAGTARAAYQSGVGMVERTQDAFAGPIRLRLVAARIGGEERTF